MLKPFFKTWFLKGNKMLKNAKESSEYSGIFFFNMESSKVKFIPH
jgi:hypothetical protein